jgi:hypothetical protein
VVRPLNAGLIAVVRAAKDAIEVARKKNEETPIFDLPSAAI